MGGGFVALDLCSPRRGCRGGGANEEQDSHQPGQMVSSCDRCSKNEERRFLFHSSLFCKKVGEKQKAISGGARSGFQTVSPTTKSPPGGLHVNSCELVVQYARYTTNIVIQLID